MIRQSVNFIFFRIHATKPLLRTIVSMSLDLGLEISREMREPSSASFGDSLEHLWQKMHPQDTDLLMDIHLKELILKWGSILLAQEIGPN